MSCYIESRLNAITSWAQDNIEGDHFRCPGCEEMKPLAHANTMSPDPYSLPYCGDCLDACCLEKYGKTYCDLVGAKPEVEL